MPKSREAALSALRESEERFRAVIAALEEGIVIHEADGSISSCNASACRILGLPQEQILGRTARNPGWRAIREDGSPFEPESHPATITLLTGQACSRVIMGIERQDGTRAWISLNSRPLRRDGDSDPYAVAVSFTDITHLKTHELELQEQADQQSVLNNLLRNASTEWRLTFDALIHPLLLVELDGRVVRLNRAARDLAGVEFDEAVDHPLSILGDNQPWRAIRELLAETAGTDAKSSVRARDDQGRSWDISMSPVITNPDGQRGVVVVARDITDLVRLQESLRRSETMSAMGALVAGVAHEVRNPLFGISATLDAFESRFGSKKDFRRYFDVLQGEVRRLSELMHQLLEYGKPARLDLAEVGADEILAMACTACGPLAERAGVTIVPELPEVAAGLPPVKVDRGRISQVFLNLLENAIQHSPRGGSVVLRAERVIPDGADAGRQGVRFVVEDSGPGFLPGDLHHVFEPFFTRRRGGTGLGLSIVQRIVEQHGGEVVAANRPGKGAVIQVFLPLRPKGAAGAAAPVLAELAK
ncbi:MAG TPA: ATP-binding protein [Thermoanaerobaculia bacterium]|jgi:PAS domain S-box-containing protein|nr:ATP-binding protein [Thermoanaerobaculia bacterium]